MIRKYLCKNIKGGIVIKEIDTIFSASAVKYLQKCGLVVQHVFNKELSNEEILDWLFLNE